MALAVKVLAVAIPDASVVTVALLVKAPLAPLPGGAKVTLTPGITLPEASLTTALSAVAKAVLTVALWVLPAVTVIDATAPGLLVRLKVVLGLLPPAAVAVTV